MSDPPEALRALLRRDDWFASCPPALQQALLALAQPLRLAAGERLFARGSGSEGLCCVTEGALQVGALTADGELRLLATLGPGQWFGEIALIDGGPRTHDAEADGPTALLLVPAGALRDWLAAHPAHWRDLARLVCTKLRASFQALEDSGRGTLEQRLARRLLLLARGYGTQQRQPGRLLRLPQERLAQMLGLSRQSVNPALRAMAARGWLALHYGTVELLDLAALQAAADGLTDPSPDGPAPRLPRIRPPQKDAR